MVKTSALVLAACLVALVPAGSAVAQSAGSAALPQGRPAYPVGAYPLSPYSSAPLPLLGPWGTCAYGNCVDSPALRSAIRRELQRQALRHELDLQAEAAARGVEPYRAPRYLPPATPESQVQPGYRGSGEVRAEYRTSGQAR